MGILKDGLEGWIVATYLLTVSENNNGRVNVIRCSAAVAATFFLSRITNTLAKMQWQDGVLMIGWWRSTRFQIGCTGKSYKYKNKIFLACSFLLWAFIICSFTVDCIGCNTCQQWFVHLFNKLEKTTPTRRVGDTVFNNEEFGSTNIELDPAWSTEGIRLHAKKIQIKRCKSASL